MTGEQLADYTQDQYWDGVDVAGVRFPKGRIFGDRYRAEAARNFNMHIQRPNTFIRINADMIMRLSVSWPDSPTISQLPASSLPPGSVLFCRQAKRRVANGQPLGSAGARYSHEDKLQMWTPTVLFWTPPGSGLQAKDDQDAEGHVDDGDPIWGKTWEDQYLNAKMGLRLTEHDVICNTQLYLGRWAINSKLGGVLCARTPEVGYIPLDLFNQWADTGNNRYKLRGVVQ